MRTHSIPQYFCRRILHRMSYVYSHYFRELKAWDDSNGLLRGSVGLRFSLPLSNFRSPAGRITRRSVLRHIGNITYNVIFITKAAGCFRWLIAFSALAARTRVQEPCPRREDFEMPEAAISHRTLSHLISQGSGLILSGNSTRYSPKRPEAVTTGCVVCY